MQKDRIEEAVLFANRGRCCGSGDVLWRVNFIWLASPLDLRQTPSVPRCLLAALLWHRHPNPSACSFQSTCITFLCDLCHITSPLTELRCVMRLQLKRSTHGRDWPQVRSLELMQNRSSFRIWARPPRGPAAPMPTKKALSR